MRIVSVNSNGDLTLDTGMILHGGEITDISIDQDMIPLELGGSNITLPRSTAYVKMRCYGVSYGNAAPLNDEYDYDTDENSVNVPSFAPSKPPDVLDGVFDDNQELTDLLNKVYPDDQRTSALLA